MKILLSEFFSREPFRTQKFPNIRYVGGFHAGPGDGDDIITELA